ncbi:MAG: peptidylprolyl isomerase [Acidobacteriota bacterium]|nr:peptidylprolyl isomerase [Acidobacteriota bacterium]
MKFYLLMSIIAFALPVAAAIAEEAASGPRVALETSKGTIVMELASEDAPVTTASFLEAVRAGFYDGTVFHRVIGNFMVQGGGYGEDLTLKPTDTALVNEADNGLMNERGTVAMARRPDPHSASTQFFVNLVDNPSLNHRSKSDQGWGYTVFGRVVDGMDVVDAIGAVETGFVAGMQDVPKEPVVIEKATVVE